MEGEAPIQMFFNVTERPDWVQVIQREIDTGWSWKTISMLWGPIYPIAVIISLLLLVGILYCTFRILQIRRAEYHKFHRHAHTVEARDVPRTQLRWEKVMEHARSSNDHEWRLAILEADIMLNELLDVLGYKGETMGDKMKQVRRADFQSIDDAWEAHKVRNRVAHDGSEHPLSEQDKNRVIALYGRVFREFGFIS